ncbi:MAG TPA: hypothetical protein EYN69_06475 [Flavobacteriales bacterium]|nr:hypothetical protein [Flavobacteriales bacterium]
MKSTKLMNYKSQLPKMYTSIWLPQTFRLSYVKTIWQARMLLRFCACCMAFIDNNVSNKDSALGFTQGVGFIFVGKSFILLQNELQLSSLLVHR